MRKIDLTRKEYQKIRKFDHNQMTAYMQDVYEKGARDGQRGLAGDEVSVDLKGLTEHLQNIRGIGAAKARFVAEAVSEYIERGNVANECSTEISGE